jgi:hypothetical protein
MKIRKPNRVTTPRQAVLDGTRTNHASMPRARGRWLLGSSRNQASATSRALVTRCEPLDDASPKELNHDCL